MAPGKPVRRGMSCAWFGSRFRYFWLVEWWPGEGPADRMDNDRLMHWIIPETGKVA